MVFKQVRRNMSKSDSGFLLEVAESAAEQAGRKLRTLFRRKLSIRRKYDYEGSIVTNADLAAEKLGFHLTATDLLEHIPIILNDPMRHKPILEKRLNQT